jgi:RES domain-containing protein
VRVVRLCTRKHAELDGEGARILGGRWNSPGRAVIYTASCGALAALEYLVHMANLPANMLLIRIEVPDTLAVETIDSLPADERAFRQLGDEWLDRSSPHRERLAGANSLFGNRMTEYGRLLCTHVICD